MNAKHRVAGYCQTKLLEINAKTIKNQLLLDVHFPGNSLLQSGQSDFMSHTRTGRLHSVITGILPSVALGCSCNFYNLCY